MKEYHYHPEYKYFLYETDAFSSPREPGEYLVSANATLTVPPVTAPGLIPIFNGTSWNIIEDNRGVYYCKDTLCCCNVEDPSANVNNLTTIAPPEQERLSNQVIKWCCDSNDWIIENLPEPEPPSQPEDIEENPFETMTVEEKLAVIGLTVEDLKGLLLSQD